MRLLRFDDLGKIERPGCEDDSQKGNPHGNFIADHLGSSPQAPQEGIAVIRRPASQNDPINSQRGKSEEEDDARIDIGDAKGNVMSQDRHSSPKRDQGKCKKGCEKGDGGSQPISEEVDASWLKPLFASKV